jgi:K+-transporting ATPase ATPase C chain
MGKMIAKSIWLLFFAVIVCCVIYPLSLWCIGQTLFPFQANGSLLIDNNTIMGSHLIAQSFTKDEYFHPRPSAASYDAAASSSSSLAASNKALRDRVTKAIPDILKTQNGVTQNIPADLITTSASGLDPHITLQAAQYQLERVAKKWASRLKRDSHEIENEITDLLEKQASAPLYGLAGEKIINVLEVNYALYQRYENREP